MLSMLQESNAMFAAYDMIRVLLEHLDEVTYNILKTEDKYIGPVSYWKG
jgi:hypothetical protein